MVSARLTIVRIALVAAALIAAGPPSAVLAQSFETKARQAFMVDAETGAVLYAKDADAEIEPAALVKIMTMAVVFDALKTGQVTMDTTYPVSENAWRTGGAPSRGSTMFAALKSQIRLEDLIQGVIVQSANDGCIIIAEGLSGSETAFVERMNKRARDLGLTVSTFRNSSGLPAEGQVVTARELVALGRHVREAYPDLYRFYSQPDFTWNKIFQRNRNPLLPMGIGADGMGTGYTDASGFGILASVNRGGRRVFAAMSGLGSEKERADEARKMLDFGIDGFSKMALLKAGDAVGRIDVYGGARGAVTVKVDQAVSILVPTANDRPVNARIVYQGPISAPIAAGDRIGSLRVSIGATPSLDVPLFAAESVALGSIHSRAFDAVAELLVGWLRGQV